MIKAISKLAAIGLSLALLSACSDQYKIVNPGGTSDDMYDMIDRVQQVGASNFNSNLAEDLLADETSTIYFTKSGTNGLQPESVFSMADASPFTGFGNYDGQYPNVFQLGLDQVSIAFVDARDSSNSQHFMLLIEFSYQNPNDGYASAFKSISGPGSHGYSEDMLEVRFVSEGASQETIILRTFDLDEDVANKLGDNVQFQVFVLDGSGVEYSIGQFSTLAGFGS